MGQSAQPATPEGIVEAKTRPRLGVRDWLDFLLLLGALATVALPMSAPGRTIENDIWWHLRTGEWILQHGQVPHTDLFSTAMMGKPWIVYTWLFDLLCIKLFGWMGIRGIIVLTSVTVLFAVAVLVAILARYTFPLRAIGLAYVGYWAMFVLKSPRPWLFSILFFLIELWLLLEACERSRPWLLLWIVPLIALWANTHIQFLYGLALIGLFAVQQALPADLGLPLHKPDWKISGRWLWGCLAASTLATLANPYGWKLYTEVYSYAKETATYDLIQEMQSPSFRGFDDWILLALVFGAWFILGQLKIRPVYLVLLMAAACWCGFRAQRDVWFPAIAACLVFARWLEAPDLKGLTLNWKAWVGAVVLALAFAFPNPGWGVTEATLWKDVEEQYPVKACDFVESHHLQGPLYNGYNWGGYLIWRLRDLTVSMDPRAHVHGGERLRTSVNTLRGYQWEQDKDLQNANTVLIPKDSGLTSVLRLSPKYRVVYEDKQAVVFQPVR